MEGIETVREIGECKSELPNATGRSELSAELESMEPNQEVQILNTDGAPFAGAVTRSVWYPARIGLNRAIGLYFDCFFLLVLWGIAGAIHSHKIPHWDLNFELYDPLAILARANWFNFSVFTPIPLICLRLACKIIMAASTPGELLCGLVSASSSRLPIRILQNIGFALVQYIVVIVSALGAYFSAALVYVLFGFFCLALLKIDWTTEFILGPALLVFLVCLAALMFCYLTCFFVPLRSAQLECWLDRLLCMKVTDNGWLSFGSRREKTKSIAKTVS